MYPNPAKDFIKIDYNNINGLTETKIIVFDLQGKKVLEAIIALEPGKKTIQFPLTFLSEGMYTLSFDVGVGEKITRKLALKK